jgi:hypothetical protein
MPTPKTIRVFVALADNRQGIAPVPAKIGNGDDPENNLYWGCDDGLKAYFNRSASRWKRVSSQKHPMPGVLERLTFQHKTHNAILIADAYQGLKIREAITQYCATSVTGTQDETALTAYIGHNGLMNFPLPSLPRTRAASHIPTIALACQSHAYFTQLLQSHGASPLLMTTQLMYPGSFILHDALESWFAGGSKEEIRLAAARAYAKNQKISVKSASGVFIAP